MKFKNITKECRDNLLHEIETILDTRDKRYMFIFWSVKPIGLQPMGYKRPAEC